MVFDTCCSVLAFTCVCVCVCVHAVLVMPHRRHHTVIIQKKTKKAKQDIKTTTDTTTNTIQNNIYDTIRYKKFLKRGVLQISLMQCI